MPNLLDCYVTRVGKVYMDFGKWWIDVEYTSYGVLGETSIMCNSKKEANTIKIGFHFLS